MALELTSMAGAGGPGAIQPGSPGQGGPTGMPSAPGESDMQRFQAAMEGPQDSAAVEGAATVAGTETHALPPSGGMGDRILQGMTQIGQQIQGNREMAAQAIGNPDVTQADLLRVNFAMIESSTLVSAVSKTAEKINQGLKTLQQG